MRHFKQQAGDGLRQPRRGMAAILAMLFLVLFATLAIGFYSQTTTSSQMASNDQQVDNAYLSAESGMDFMRYELANVTIPPNTPSDQVITKLYQSLQTQLNGTGNLGGISIALSNNTIGVPDLNDNTIKLDSSNNSRFRATITNWAGDIVVKVDGYYGTTICRAFTMDYTLKPKQTSIFSYAVASKGQVVASKGSITSVAGVDPSVAQVMSAEASGGAVTVSGATIGGDLSYVDGGGVSVTGGSVAGSSSISDIMNNHVHEVDMPEFPVIDTTVYRQYATNTYGGGGTQANIYIPPNTNPKFNGNNTVQGIMYIATPNTVTFNGNFTLQGFIVVDNSTSNTATLNFSGNVTMSALPDDPQFDSLRSVSGVAVMAPTASMSMTGSSSSLHGNVLVNTFDFGGAGAIQIDRGSIITMGTGSDTANFHSSKTIRFSATGESNQPNIGLSYSGSFLPKPTSYQEVMP